MKKNNKTLLELLAGVIFTSSSIYAVNRIIFYLSQQKDSFIGKHHYTYAHKQGNIKYTKTGTGSPLLLLHNLDCASSSYEWDEVISTLSKNHTVYALDLIGCGNSDKPRITYTSFLYVQTIYDFIKEVIRDEVDVIATGNMAPIAFLIEHMHPKTFQHFIFVNPEDFNQTSIMPSAKDTYRKELLEMPIIGTSLYQLYYAKSALFARFSTKYFGDSNNKKLKYVRRYYAAAHRGGSNCKFLHASLCTHYLGSNIKSCYKDVNVPTCIIFGKDMHYETDFSTWGVFLNPNTEVAIIPDTKFLPQLEKPGEFTDICDLYLTEGTIEKDLL